MKWSHPGLVRLILVIVFSAVIASAVACAPAPMTAPVEQPPAAPPVAPVTPAPTAPSYTISTTNKVGIGDYFVDSKGMSLYYFLKDSKNKSNATAAIVKIWPVFYAASIVVPPTLSATDFGTITRDDGTMQTTYKGWPLYYYAKDLVAGDTMGQQFNNLWFVVTTASDFLPAPAAPLSPAPPATNAPPQASPTYTY